MEELRREANDGSHGKAIGPEAVPPRSDPAELAAEVARVSSEDTLAENGGLSVVLVRGDDAPHVLFEIGRLRELTFRAVGEGTGSRLDLDWFDSFYMHLVVWNRRMREVVGAYRIGPTDTILTRYGIDGLYTSTLFHYRMELFARINPALELGRTFVREEYQRSYAPLLLLWTGIARFVARHPHYRCVFGAVSISNDYDPRSQQLMLEHLRTNHGLSSLERFLRGRRAVGLAAQSTAHPAAAAGATIEDLDEAVTVLEEGRRKLPVLVRQYIKLGGKVLAFSRDPDFGSTLDGLILVDLAKTPPRVLARYMGTEETAAFLEVHQHAAHLRQSRELPNAAL